MCGGGAAMEHLGILGAHLYPHAHAEPISFGIDQILSTVEHSCMLGARGPEPDYGPAAYGGSGYACGSGGYGGSGGSYHGNMCGNGSVASNAAGVLRVPAHRPLGCGAAAGPPVNTLTFPWMESNRRYTKERFTGTSALDFILLIIKIIIERRKRRERKTVRLARDAVDQEHLRSPPDRYRVRFLFYVRRAGGVNNLRLD